VLATRAELQRPFEPRGTIEAKHGRRLDMYFLNRLKPELSRDAAGLEPNEKFTQECARLITGFSAWGSTGAQEGVAFYIWVGIFNAFVISQVWAFATDLYSEGQGKRLFPLIGIGSSLGAWLGAQAAERASAGLGATDHDAELLSERLSLQAVTDRLAAKRSTVPLPPTRGRGRTVILTSGTTGTPKGAQRTTVGGVSGLAGLPAVVPVPARHPVVTPVAAPHPPKGPAEVERLQHRVAVASVAKVL